VEVGARSWGANYISTLKPPKTGEEDRREAKLKPINSNYFKQSWLLEVMILQFAKSRTTVGEATTSLIVQRSKGSWSTPKPDDLCLCVCVIIFSFTNTPTFSWINPYVYWLCYLSEKCMTRCRTFPFLIFPLKQLKFLSLLSGSKLCLQLINVTIFES
jgi:hypothetical protein